VKLVDAMLLYAVDESAEQHMQAREWLDSALSGPHAIILPWVCLPAFMRITTHPGIHPKPLSAENACSIVTAWTGRPNVVPAEPTARHSLVLAELLAVTGSGGNLVNDAHLAALAIEHDATVVTFDNDFSRFPGVRWKGRSMARNTRT
jgi:toxin-antitoxin system PIN domain toxin